MSLELIKGVRARTRGKSPQEFTFDGYGKVSARSVQDKDGIPVAVDAEGKPAKVTYNEEKKEYETDGRFVEVDDLVVDGETVTDKSLPEVLSIFGGNMVDLLIGAVQFRNSQLRKEASPVSEPEPDELAPFVEVLRKAGLITDSVKDGKTIDGAGVWRRTITMAANQFEMDKVAYIKMNPKYRKALEAAGL